MPPSPPPRSPPPSPRRRRLHSLPSLPPLRVECHLHRRPRHRHLRLRRHHPRHSNVLDLATSAIASVRMFQR
eukprot:2979736-Prymnesium_polylepis.1